MPDPRDSRSAEDSAKEILGIDDWNDVSKDDDEDDEDDQDNKKKKN